MKLVLEDMVESLILHQLCAKRYDGRRKFASNRC